MPKGLMVLALQRNSVSSGSIFNGLLNGQTKDEVVFSVPGQDFLPLVPVRHGATQRLPKRRSVVAFAQMNQFVHDDVVHEPEIE